MMLSASSFEESNGNRSDTVDCRCCAVIIFCEAGRESERRNRPGQLRTTTGSPRIAWWRGVQRKPSRTSDPARGTLNDSPSGGRTRPGRALGAFGQKVSHRRSVRFADVPFVVAQRIHEFGVRVALGASSRNLVQLTILRGVIPVAAGIAAGVMIALAASRLLEGLLFEVSPRDPVVLAGGSVLLLVVAILASLVPAVRATRVDPAAALRAD